MKTTVRSFALSKGFANKVARVVSPYLNLENELLEYHWMRYITVNQIYIGVAINLIRPSGGLGFPK